MADNELENVLDQPSEAEKRIKTLSEKVRLTAEERDEKDRLLKEQTDKATASEKKAAFYKDFSKISAEYKDAPEFADEIEAKVLSGYSPKDAAISVLMEKGKFNPTLQVERQNVAGGSSSTSLPSQEQKSVSQMSRDEKRAALIEAESRGDIALT